MVKVGIEAIAFDFPKIFLSVEEFATYRNQDATKLTAGLGIQKISFPDIHQDVVTFAANALEKLVSQEDISFSEIAKIYIGTESGVDSSKPIGSYLFNMMEQKYGKGKLEHCDTTEFTFACIGAVDAMHNALDFIRCNPTEKVIVIATDFAKYDLNSTGEYTQGAGAIAMLLSANPELIEIHPEIGISTEGVFDFFKPRRNFKEGAFSVETNIESNQIHESELLVYKEQPVFDGAYSQKCYVSRTKNAYLQLKKKLQTSEKLYENWDAIVMHLPYCFQARRSFIDIFAEENPDLLESQPGETLADKSKALYKSDAYATLVENKIAKTESLSGIIGNIYTGSIFLAFLGYLFSYKDQNIANHSVGFIAYGSGSKSKAFIGSIGTFYEEKIAKLPFEEILSNTTPINFDTYVALHTKNQKKSVVPPKKEWILQRIEQSQPNLVGARYYQWID